MDSSEEREIHISPQMQILAVHLHYVIVIW